MKPAEANKANAVAAKCAKCSNCLFGKSRVVLMDDDKDGGQVTREVVRCHVSRPTSTRGFPIVLPDDFCGMHTDSTTGTRTFAWCLSDDNTHA